MAAGKCLLLKVIIWLQSEETAHYQTIGCTSLGIQTRHEDIGI